MQAVEGVSFGMIILFSSFIVLMIYVLLGIYNDDRLKLVDKMSKTSSPPNKQ